MATLNELGRNSASVTYGPYATGADLFPTLQAVDAWFRNDTWQGTAVASGTAVTGTGSIYTTQARVGDYIMIAGQQRIVTAVNSDTSLTVGVAFSPAITVPSAVKAISNFQTTQSAGYVSTIVRGATNGVVSVTNNSQTVTGVGTYFLSDATNSITTVAMAGTVAMDTTGTITGTSTLFVSGAGTNNGLYPGDSIAITLATGAIYYFIVATVTNDTSATVTIPPTLAIASGSSITKATNGVVGRTININGRLRTITAISSNTSMTVNFPMDFTDSNLRYKVYPRGTVSNANAAAGTLYGVTSATSTGTTTLTLNTMTTNAVAMPGAYLAVPPGTGTATTSVPAGTYIVNQIYGVSAGSAANSTAVTGTVGTNVISLTGSVTGTVLVGHLVCGNGASITGIPAGTYVVAVSGTTVTLSQNLTTGYVSSTVYFYVPGGTGNYTTSQATTITATALTISSVQATGANWFWDLGYNNLNSTTNTAYMYQTSQLDQVWLGDEVRTMNFSTFSGALTTTNTLYGYITDYVGYSGTATGVLRQIVYQIPYRREDSYVNGTLYGTTAAFLSDLRVGDDIIIDGTECTVTSLVSNTQFKVNIDFTHTTAVNSGAAATASTTQASGGAPAATTFVVSSATGIVIGQLVTGIGLPQGTYVTNLSSTTVTVSNAFTIQATGTYNFYNGTNLYKKLKLHGYTLEGTREGGPGLAGTSAGPVAVFTSSSASASTTALTLTTISANSALPGQQVIPTTLSGANVGGLTYLTAQQYGSSASITFTTTAVITPSGSTTLTFTAAPSTVTVGMLVQSGASAAFTYGPASTYVTSVNTTSGVFTVTLNQPLTAPIPISTAIYFIAPGGPGIYTTNVATTTQAALSFYTPTTGKWTQSTSILATNGTSYPIGTTQLTVATTPSVTGSYNFVKISGAGGPAQVLTGQVTSYVATFVIGVNTLFTTQLHIGAEIIVAGQYLTVVSIVSDTQLIVAQNVTTTNVVVGPTPIYRSVPLYTYVTTQSSGVITLATPIKNNLYTGIANPPQVYFTATGADFIEYVYSAPNYSAQQGSATLLNQSLDRKYVGFRYWPLYQSTNSALNTATALTTAQGAYAVSVYERWTASYAQTHGVGVNQADQSGGTMVWGNIATTTTLAVQMPVCGSLNTQMGVQGLSTGYPDTLTGTVTSFNSNTMGLANVIYAITTTSASTTNAPVVGSLYGVYDIVGTTQISGGTIFLFGNSRYFAIQSRTSANIQAQWMGCIEFERAQPEDASTGTGSTSGVTFGGGALVNYYGGSQLAAGVTLPTTASPGFNQSIQFTSGTAPYPTFAYVNGNRLPTGAQQIPTLPQQGTAAYPIHGCVLAVPRVRNTVSDLVGFNAHIYSALTVTTGRWGHMMEFGNYGTYNPAYLGTLFTPSSNTLTLTANTIPQVHMGQIIPVYTNIYNAKRFMFSPVVVLGPAYDPDVRGRLYGIKILPSGLGTLMDTVSITINNNSGTYNAALGSTATTDMFYNTSGTAADHWVLTTPALPIAATLLPGQTPVITERFTLTANTPQIQQSWRSLEDVSQNATAASSALTYNNFRFAFPA
jgi:hypothetical protein